MFARFSITQQVYIEFSPLTPLQFRLRAAARAKLMRWVKPKTKRSDRESPDIVKSQWNTGNKNDLADLLVKANFNQDISNEHMHFR